MGEGNYSMSKVFSDSGKEFSNGRSNISIQQAELMSERREWVRNNLQDKLAVIINDFHARES